MSYTQKLLEIMHTAHCGEEPTQWLSYFWKHPLGRQRNMDDDIQAVVRKCDKCQKSRPSQPGQPIMQMNKATFPMQVVGTDLYQEMGKHFIVIVDQFSGFPMVGQFLTHPSTNSVLNHLEDWFNLFGVPEELVSDNGPQYASVDYKAYPEERKIR